MMISQHTFTSFLFIFLLFNRLALMAISDDDNFANEKMTRPECLRPFKLFGSADATGKADFCKKELRHQQIRYVDVNTNATTTLRFNQKKGEGAQAVVGYEYTKIEWSEHVCYEKQEFNTLRVGMNLFSARLPRWMWQGYVILNLDTDHWNFNHYSTWDLLLWGRNQYLNHPDIGLHFGFLALTGMKIDRVYPIIGLDWQCTKKLKLNLVFPIKISLEYTPSKDWSCGFSGRFFESRHRLGYQPVLPYGLIQYRSTGAELYLSYDNCTRMSFNLHGGYLIGGRIKLSNRHNDHGRWLKFGGSGYGGGELAVKF